MMTINNFKFPSKKRQDEDKERNARLRNLRITPEVDLNGNDIATADNTDIEKIKVLLLEMMMTTEMAICLQNEH